MSRRQTSRWELFLKRDSKKKKKAVVENAIDKGVLELQVGMQFGSPKEKNVC